MLRSCVTERNQEPALVTFLCNRARQQKNYIVLWFFLKNSLWNSRYKNAWKFLPWKYPYHLSVNKVINYVLVGHSLTKQNHAWDLLVSELVWHFLLINQKFYFFFYTIFQINQWLVLRPRINFHAQCVNEISKLFTLFCRIGEVRYYIDS